MISIPISRCALKCAHIPQSAISSIISKSFLQASSFSTCRQTLVYKTESEDRPFEKYIEKSTQEPMHFQKKGSLVPEERTIAKIDAASEENKDDYVLPHPCWSKEEA